MEQRITYEVVVHKANLPLAKGESVSQFTSRLREAAAKQIAMKLNLTPQNCSVYMVETFADSAIFDVSKRPAVTGDAWSYAYYAAKYTRKVDGSFEFGETTEVERVTSYQPKPKMDVTTATNKAKKDMLEDDEEEEDDLEDEETEELAKKPKKSDAKKEAPPGWAYTTKNLWNGLL